MGRSEVAICGANWGGGEATKVVETGVYVRAYRISRCAELYIMFVLLKGKKQGTL